MNRRILRCILIIYYITNQNSALCNILLCGDSPYCDPCISNDMFSSLLCNCLKIYYKRILFYIQTNNGTVIKTDNPSSKKTMPVLASQFFKINLLHTSKNVFFDDSRSSNNSSGKHINHCDEHWLENKFLFGIDRIVEKIDTFQACPLISTLFIRIHSASE